MTRLVAGLSLTVAMIVAHAQQLPRVDSPRPRGYVAGRAGAPIKIDGSLDDAAWAGAAWTDEFVDIEGDAKPRPRLSTRAKMLWDDRYFYIGARLDEPHLWGTITEHDAVIFRDNDFEVFIDPDGDSHDYREFEINARGAFWDLLLPRPYRAGGQAIDSWDIHGLKSAVHLNGTLNNPADIDLGWTVELAFPWSAFSADERQPTVPKDGDQWRVNFSRVEWVLDVVNGAYRPKPGAAEHNWVWSPQHAVDMHRPERWGYVQFSSREAASGVSAAAFVPDVSWPARQWLQMVFEAEREFRISHGRYAATFVELGVPLPVDDALGTPNLFVTPSLFEATISLKQPAAAVWHINQDARVWRD